MSPNFTPPFLIRRLFWYVAFCVVLGPLILAPFTAGVSLAWYVLYFTAPFLQGDAQVGWYIWGIPIGIGILLWICRVFIGLFFHHWRDDHLERIESGSVLTGLRR